MRSHVEDCRRPSCQRIPRAGDVPGAGWMASITLFRRRGDALPRLDQVGDLVAVDHEPNRGRLDPGHRPVALKRDPVHAVDTIRATFRSAATRVNTVRLDLGGWVAERITLLASAKLAPPDGPPLPNAPHARVRTRYGA